jgi:hypothetical protein
MPIVRNVIGGAQVVASAKIARRFMISAAAGATSLESLAMLQVNTQPNCFYYAIMTSGPAGTTFTPKFAVDNTTPGPSPRWFPVLIPQLLVLGVPFFATQRLVANMISGVVTVPGGGAGAVVQVILSSSI